MRQHQVVLVHSNPPKHQIMQIVCPVVGQQGQQNEEEVSWEIVARHRVRISHFIQSEHGVGCRRGGECRVVRLATKHSAPAVPNQIFKDMVHCIIQGISHL